MFFYKNTFYCLYFPLLNSSGYFGTSKQDGLWAMGGCKGPIFKFTKGWQTSSVWPCLTCVRDRNQRCIISKEQINYIYIKLYYIKPYCQHFSCVAHCGSPPPPQKKRNTVQWIVYNQHIFRHKKTDRICAKLREVSIVFQRIENQCAQYNIPTCSSILYLRVEAQVSGCLVC